MWEGSELLRTKGFQLGVALLQVFIITHPSPSPLHQTRGTSGSQESQPQDGATHALSHDFRWSCNTMDRETDLQKAKFCVRVHH